MAPARTYSVAAIVLHWAIAFAIVLMIPLGWWMSDAIEDPSTRPQAAAAFQLHKSIGLTILALSLARLGLRFLRPPPPPPDGMGRLQRFAAGGAHALFYALMIGLPVSGWVYVSTGYTWDGRPFALPTSWFGLFEVPHLPIAGEPAEIRRQAAAGSMSAHSALAWGAILLLVVHVGAALKHQFLDRDGVLARMVPGLRPPLAETPPRRRALAAGAGLIALAGLGVAVALATLPTPSSLQPQAAAEDIPQVAIIAGEPAPDATGPAATEPTATGPAPAAAPSAAGPAPLWVVDPKASALRFQAVHAGAAFTGEFRDWSAEIRFDPDNLAGSSAVVRVATGSARTGDGTRDAALPQAEWFDSAAHPQAVFATREIRALGGGRYEALGDLTIKGASAPVRLAFTLAIDGDAATMSGSARLDRVALGLGLASDPGADWVSREVVIETEVSARRR